jgi:rubrerythrin
MDDFPDETPIEAPPAITGPDSPMPMEWADHIPRHRELWEKAEAQHYDPNTVVDWSALKATDFSEDDRLAIAYWFATGSVFENSGVPTFAYGMVKSYEEHLGDSTNRVLLTIARDESNHDEMSRRIVQKLLPGFPNDFTPANAAQRAAANNLAWIQYTNSRYWAGYKGAYDTRTVPAVMAAFVAGEAAASLIYTETAKRTKHPILSQVLHRIGVDESRHFACFNLMAQEHWERLSPKDKAGITKNLKAAYVYISVVFGEAKPPFWKVPASFDDTHVKLQRAAREAGLGLLSDDERRDIWRRAMLRVKNLTDRSGVEFPAIEELGIDGADTPIKEEDLVVVSF